MMSINSSDSTSKEAPKNVIARVDNGGFQRDNDQDDEECEQMNSEEVRREIERDELESDVIERVRIVSFKGETWRIGVLVMDGVKTRQEREAFGIVEEISMNRIREDLTRTENHKGVFNDVPWHWQGRSDIE